MPLPEQAAALVEGTILGAYSPGRLKAQNETRAPERIVIGHESDPALEAAVERAAIVAEQANRADKQAAWGLVELVMSLLGA